MTSSPRSGSLSFVSDRENPAVEFENGMADHIILRPRPWYAHWEKSSG